MNTETRNMDIRIRARNLKSGLINHSQVKSYVDSLVDQTDQCQPVDLVQPALFSVEESDTDETDEL